MNAGRLVLAVFGLAVAVLGRRRYLREAHTNAWSPIERRFNELAPLVPLGFAILFFVTAWG